jgi:hypothetical protein
MGCARINHWCASAAADVRGIVDVVACRIAIGTS